MKIAHQCKDHGIKDVTLSSVVAAGRVNDDVFIHFNHWRMFVRQIGFVL